MKVCVAPGWAHPKNMHGFLLLVAHASSIGAWEFTSNPNEADIVWSPSENKPYPNASCVLYGPHFSVLPDSKYFLIPKRSGVAYIHPCEWSKNVWDETGADNIPSAILPFPVDVDRFCPAISLLRSGCMVYTKNRNPKDVALLVTYLHKAGHAPVLFSYDNKYNELEYLSALRTCAFVVWIGCHESQGFALQEALSVNVPILVWSTRRMSEEYNSPESYRIVQSSVSSAPYFSPKCGEIVYSFDDFVNVLPTFINRLGDFSPREYVLDKLSAAAVYKKYWAPGLSVLLRKSNIAVQTAL